ncbi:MAG: hypothetical protein QOF78_3453 [Phycisphaerales bacterium]|jgi:hypothetical protein|nr:hypothetical protein [Phycisphaerales bacterium]
MSPLGSCEVCGSPGSVHVAETVGGQNRTRSFCAAHSPFPGPDKAPFGPHRTPSEEAAWLRSKLPELDRKVSDPAERAQYRAELEQLAADIEAGRRRLGDAH